MRKGPALVLGSALANAEFGASSATIAAVKAGQIAQALGGLKEPDKIGLAKNLTELRLPITQAIDSLKAKRSRLREINSLLDSGTSEFKAANASLSRFYGLAAPAIKGSKNVMFAAKTAKSAIDSIFAEDREMKYRKSVLAEMNSDIESELLKFQMAINVLDEMLVAIT